MQGRKKKPRPLSEAARATGAGALPRCPGHLSPVARKEWRRIARPMHRLGILTLVDRAALAAYCQAYAKWVEAEEQLKKTPPLLKTPSGYVQQSPWISIANKQLEVMGRYMTELGITPASRQRVQATNGELAEEPRKIFRVIIGKDETDDANGGEEAPDYSGGRRNSNTVRLSPDVRKI